MPDDRKLTISDVLLPILGGIAGLNPNIARGIGTATDIYNSRERQRRAEEEAAARQEMAQQRMALSQQTNERADAAMRRQTLRDLVDDQRYEALLKRQAEEKAAATQAAQQVAETKTATTNRRMTETERHNRAMEAKGQKPKEVQEKPLNHEKTVDRLNNIYAEIGKVQAEFQKLMEFADPNGFIPPEVEVQQSILRDRMKNLLEERDRLKSTIDSGSTESTLEMHRPPTIGAAVSHLTPKKRTMEMVPAHGQPKTRSASPPKTAEEYWNY